MQSKVFSKMKKSTADHLHSDYRAKKMVNKGYVLTALWLPIIISICLRLSSGGLIQSLVETMGKAFDVTVGTFEFAANTVWSDIGEALVDTTPKNKSRYDFIVVGAGSAGAAVASRLSEVNATVLLIEAGDSEDTLMDIPLLALYLQQYKKINWNYTMDYSENYCRGMLNGQCLMPRGKVMGGCSVLNLMIATRANRRDYNNWAQKLNCTGWSYREVRKLFLKMEHFEAINPRANTKNHGYKGLLNVASAPYRTGASRAFLKAARERGFPLVDYDGREQMGYSFTYLTQKNGARHSSNRAYLTPFKDRPNLILTRNSHVEKVNFRKKTKKAYGVTFTKGGQKIKVYAKKEIILCAGAINTPKILMLSGIGPAKHLRELGIRLKKDAPVGLNLQDHLSFWGLNYLVNDTVTIITSEIFKRPDIISKYMAERNGPLTVSGGIEAAGFIDVNDLTSRKGVPNIELIYVGASIGSDPVAYRSLAINPEHYEADLKPMLNQQSFMIVPTLLTPKSRGRVYLTSKDPNENPRIHPNYFDDPDDMRRMILGIRESNALIKTEAMQKIGARLPDKPIHGCENFEWDSDAYWDCAVRTYADTLYHPAGTCKMGCLSDPTAVVDPRLKVIGVENLRVADASIMPEIVAGHTNVPTMMIGEKLAEMVKEDWKYL